MVLFETTFKGSPLVFYDDYFAYKGVHAYYDEISNISYHNGDPCFVMFDYKNRHLGIPYQKSDEKAILNIFERIKQQNNLSVTQKFQTIPEELKRQRPRMEQTAETAPLPATAKRKKKKKKFIIAIPLIILLLLAAGIFFGNNSQQSQYDSLDDSQATIENPADPTKKATIESYSGVFSVQLDNTYTGANAVNFLASIGEDASDYSGENIIEEGYKLVVQEYTVSADQGYEDEPLYGYDALSGNDKWDMEHESKYEYAVFDLYQNASLDYYQLELKNGESSKMYYVFEIPADVNEYIASVSGYNRDFWFVYDISQ